MMDNLAQLIEDELLLLKNDEKAQFLQGFFKTGKGQYAEGDRFLGIVVPAQRKIAKAYYKAVEVDTLSGLLKSPWHEFRLTALIILAMKMEKEKDAVKCQNMVDFYLAHIDYINNWDLVDLSAPYVIGKHLMDSDKTLLYTLADSGKLWEQRIAIISTLHFVRKKHYDTSLAITEKLLNHKHDLIHKACGWVLREVGKRNEDVEKEFLDKYYLSMPRTMLRYAIERFGDSDRKHYMAKK